jgi:hypothetical protein
VTNGSHGLRTLMPGARLNLQELPYPRAIAPGKAAEVLPARAAGASRSQFAVRPGNMLADKADFKSRIIPYE